VEQFGSTGLWGGDLFEGEECCGGVGQGKVGGVGSLGAGEGDKPAGGVESGAGGGEGGGRVVDGAEGDDVEEAGGGKVLDAGCVDGGLLWREVEGAEGFTEEGGFFVLGLGEGDVEMGEGELDGEAREAGAGAEVEEGGFPVFDQWRDVDGGEEGFAEVALDDLLGVSDGGEVGAGVPFEEEIEVGGELVVEVFGEGGGADVGGEEGGDAGCGECGHGGECKPWG
jgi:hypothetical protein